MLVFAMVVGAGWPVTLKRASKRALDEHAKRLGS
jgi:hypothetical protein